MSHRVLVWGDTPLAAWLAASLHWYTEVTWRVEESTRRDFELTGGVRLSTSTQPIKGMRLVTTYQDAPAPGLILLAAPNWRTAEFLMELRQAIDWDHAPPTIVSLQNGIGSIQRIESVFGEGHTIQAAVTRQFWHGSYRENMPVRTDIRAGTTGGVALQSDHPQSETVMRLLKQAGLTVVSGQADSIGWSSVFWGIQANALSAILDVTPRQIYQDPVWRAYEHVQLGEALRVIDALKVKLIRLPGVDVPQIAREVWLIPRRMIAPFLSRHPRPPSLRDDLRFHAGRSDAAYFNGAVAVHANQLRLRTPVNHALALVLTDIAENRMPWSMFRDNPETLLAALRVAQ